MLFKKFREQRRDRLNFEIQNAVRHSICSKYPKNVTFQEIIDTHTSFSPDQLRDSLERLKSWGDVTEISEGRYIPGNEMRGINDGLITCNKCKKEYPVKAIGYFGMGYEQLVFFYCQKDPTLLVIDDTRWEYPSTIPLTDKKKSVIEEKLPICNCGGRFRFGEPLKCPSCGEKLCQPWPSPHFYFVIDRAMGEVDYLFKDKASLPDWLRVFYGIK